MSNIKKVNVKKSDPPESDEILAEAIVKIGNAVQSLSRRGGINKKAIVTLIHDQTKLPKKIITAVLDSLPQLERLYCK